MLTQLWVPWYVICGNTVPVTAFPKLQIKIKLRKSSLLKKKCFFFYFFFLQSHKMFHTESYITKCKQLTPWDTVYLEKRRTPHHKKKIVITVLHTRCMPIHTTHPNKVQADLSVTASCTWSIIWGFTTDKRNKKK